MLTFLAEMGSRRPRTSPMSGPQCSRPSPWGRSERSGWSRAGWGSGLTGRSLHKIWASWINGLNKPHKPENSQKHFYNNFIKIVQGFRLKNAWDFSADIVLFLLLQFAFLTRVWSPASRTCSRIRTHYCLLGVECSSPLSLNHRTI